MERRKETADGLGEEILSSVSLIRRSFSDRSARKQYKEGMAFVSNHAEDIRKIISSDSELGADLINSFNILAMRVSMEEKLSCEVQGQIYSFFSNIFLPIIDEFDSSSGKFAKYKWSLADEVLTLAENAQISDYFTARLFQSISRNVDNLISGDKQDFDFRKSGEVYMALKYANNAQTSKILDMYKVFFQNNPGEIAFFTEENNWDLLDLAMMEIKNYLEKIGLPPEQILRDWRHADHRDNSRSVMTNLRAAVSLEDEKKGVCKILHDVFNISNFARYPLQVLVDQAEDINFKERYGLAIYAKDDHNGAFFGVRWYLNQLAASLNKSHYIKIFEAGSSYDVIHLLNRLRKNAKNKPEFAIIGGHGDQESIQLGSYTNIAAKDLKSTVIEAVKEKVVSDIPIILDACGTGRYSKKGLAARFSVFGYKVTAFSNAMHGIEKVVPIFDRKRIIKNFKISTNRDQDLSKIMYFEEGRKIIKK